MASSAAAAGPLRSLRILSVLLAVLALSLLCVGLVAGQRTPTQARTNQAPPTREINVRSHSLRSPYVDSNLENRYWDFGGSTVVHNNKYIRLTPDRPSRRGWLWSKEPMPAGDFTVEFEFRVDGKASRVFGDGFALWMTSERHVATGEALGGPTQFNGLAVFFDTFANTRHPYMFPYVSLMVNDGSRTYSGDDDNESNQAAGCEARFRRPTHPTRARAVYKDGVFSLDLDIRGDNTFETCFSVEDITLPDRYFLGFTAMTGDVSDEHDIISITTSMSKPVAVPPRRNHLNQPGNRQQQAGVPPRQQQPDYGQNQANRNPTHRNNVNNNNNQQQQQQQQQQPPPPYGGAHTGGHSQQQQQQHNNNQQGQPPPYTPPSRNNNNNNSPQEDTAPVPEDTGRPAGGANQGREHLPPKPSHNRRRPNRGANKATGTSGNKVSSSLSPLNWIFMFAFGSIAVVIIVLAARAVTGGHRKRF
ncbi:hypothetical protein H696_02992 [Fonticula alba]|uniref:L-type lectin-like domain-containing protein n=1 Tax=Fonticula alba TaxID=691883 RepID=A0A058Z8Q0_FONAL|nr:hypothetical protein H696_02992 [Fonticula alba]KCV70635.1 hypothetical protein H696_02992 [Fonticula alba]|eukprot:XP_009495151.1 hypothetical protein H696_02992 [Fonticula alba]